MSLLNEMLHDLAKKNPQAHSKPLLTAALAQNNSKAFKPFLVGAIGIFFVVVLVMLLKQSFTTKQASVSNKAIHSFDALHNIVPASDIVQKPVETPPKKQTLLAQSQDEHPLIPKKILKPLPKHQSVEQWIALAMKSALSDIKTGHLNDAKSSLQAILARDPGEIKARELLIGVYLSLNHYEHAIREVEEGLEYAPDNPNLITMKAKIFINQGQQDDAIALLKSDHPSIVSHPEFYATLAHALQAKGEVAEAGTYYKSLIKIDPNNGRYWLGYGISLEKNHQREQAIDAYKRAGQASVTTLAIQNQAKHRLDTLMG